MVEEEGRPAPGRLWERRGRPVWFVGRPQPVGRILTIEVELTGFEVDKLGSLEPSSPQSEAVVTLVGRVLACRFFPPGEAYVLRLNLLGRVWPKETGS